MIPELNRNGFLPPGMHDCSVGEIRERFVRFGSIGSRVRLFKMLEDYIREASSVGFLAAVIVNGSFVTAKEEPGDIDLVLVLREEVDLTRTFRPFEYNVI